MSKPVPRNLSYYDGRQFLGSMKITVRCSKRMIVKAKDVAGKNLGQFKSEKAAIAAINQAQPKMVAE